jgi:F0F1-type ATP synthase delta subunit
MNKNILAQLREVLALHQQFNETINNPEFNDNGKADFLMSDLLERYQEVTTALLASIDNEDSEHM